MGKILKRTTWNLIFSIILITFLFGAFRAGASTDSGGEIYSLPKTITATLNENIITISTKPEIWNPGNPIKGGIVEFSIKFNLTILNNSLGLTYESEFLKTELGFLEIPSGLSTHNMYTATYNFSASLSEEFNGINLFNATVDVYTTAPSNIEENYDHIAIIGSKVHIKNNEIVIQQVNPAEGWGSTTVPWIGVTSVLILVTVGILRRNRKFH